MSDAAIRFDAVTKSFGDRRVLDDVSFEIPRATAFCLLGRSGTGKSVTLRHIIGLMRPDSGRVFVNDDEISALDSRGCRASGRVWISLSECRLVRLADRGRERGVSAPPASAPTVGYCRAQRGPRQAGAGRARGRLRQDAGRALEDAEARRPRAGDGAQPAVAARR